MIRVTVWLDNLRYRVMNNLGLLLADQGSGCGPALVRAGSPRRRQRAIHERTAKVDTVKDFITWFDDTWTESASSNPPAETLYSTE
jgi:hypothetical protein